MIGAIAYELEAENDERVSEAQGRLLHGALFALIGERAPDLAARLHDDAGAKPFAIAPLELPGRAPRDGRDRQIRAGDVVYWRISALDGAVLGELLAMPPGTPVKVGRLRLRLRRAIADGDERPDTGVLDEAALIGACLSVPRLRFIELRFLTPVSFRVGDADCPSPSPVLVFSSLADKWTAAGLPAEIDREEIRAGAERIWLSKWRGATRHISFGRDRGAVGFVGTFTYDLSGLDVESRRVFLLLAQLAVFSGVGRLTGQGMGQARARYW